MSLACETTHLWVYFLHRLIMYLLLLGLQRGFMVAHRPFQNELLIDVCIAACLVSLYIDDDYVKQLT